MITNWSEVEGGSEPLVRNALERLAGAGDEIAVDFLEVYRIDAGTLRAMEELAAKAQEGSRRVVLRGVRVDVYKALKLAALAGRFSFAD